MQHQQMQPPRTPQHQVATSQCLAAHMHGSCGCPIIKLGVAACLTPSLLVTQHDNRALPG